jgi:hypothetical protein
MPLDSQMDKLQTSIWKFLVEGYSGKENVTLRRAILARYNLMHSTNLADRIFRDEVVALVTIFKKAICSTPSGYFVARTMGEKQHSLNYLDSFIGELVQHRNALAEADPLERQERLL